MVHTFGHSSRVSAREDFTAHVNGSQGKERGEIRPVYSQLLVENVTDCMASFANS